MPETPVIRPSPLPPSPQACPMAASPDIRFVITLYNKADVLPAVVRALAAQQPMPQAEYIFVDDASPEGSVALLQGLAAQLPGMNVMTNDRNAGPAIRHHQGAAAACGRYLCLGDADELNATDAVGLRRSSGAARVLPSRVITV